MNTAQLLSHSRGSFTALRFFPIVAAAILPFTFNDGFISTKLFIGSILCAVAWLASLVMAWRSRNQLWFAASFLIMMIVPRLFGAFRPEDTNAQSYQWLLYMLIFTGLPLLVLPSRMRRISRLTKTKEETSQLMRRRGSRLIILELPTGAHGLYVVQKNEDHCPAIVL